MTVRRRLLWTAVVLAVLLPPLFLGAYAATTRWLLSGPKLRALINGSPRSFMIDWDEATSSWPGRVRIHNLRLRGSDPNVQWTVRLENAELRYSVPALLRRTFRCERLERFGPRLRPARQDRSEGRQVRRRLAPAADPGIPGSAPAHARGELPRRAPSVARRRAVRRHRPVRRHLGQCPPLRRPRSRRGRIPAAADASSRASAPRRCASTAAHSASAARRRD